MFELHSLVANKKTTSNYTRTSGFYRSHSASKVVTLDSKPQTDKKSEVSLGSSSGSSSTLEGGRNRGGDFKHLTGAEMRVMREKKNMFLM